MRHHMYNPGFEFIVEPDILIKYTNRNLLQYAWDAVDAGI